MIKDALKELGLSDKEVAVYSTALEYGKLSPARIGSLTGIRRTTVYDVANVLVERGFLKEDNIKGATYYYPASSKELKAITKKERRALMEKELVIEELAKDIETLPQSKTYAVPKVRFVEHEENVESFLYERTPIWFENAKHYDNTCRGFQDHTFTGHESYRKWIGWAATSPECPATFLITNDTEAEKEMRHKNYDIRKVKFWNNAEDFSASQWIFGEYSIQVQTRDKPHYLIETHDAAYAKNMRVLFKNLWEEVN